MNAFRSSLSGTAIPVEELVTLASEAGARILQLTASGLERRLKNDKSPATAADDAAEEILLEGTAKLMPGVPVLAEETVSRVGHTDCGDFYIAIDPVDGTRELIDGRDEYTVNIGVVSGGRPAAGVLYAPARSEMFFAANGEAFKVKLAAGEKLKSGSAVPIHARAQAANLIAAVSRSHPDPNSEALLAPLPVKDRLVLGSSLKFARIAEGQADIYVRAATINEWDVAAGHAILNAAGGSVRHCDGREIVYGQPGGGYRIKGFIARGRDA